MLIIHANASCYMHAHMYMVISHEYREMGIHTCYSNLTPVLNILHLVWLTTSLTEGFLVAIENHINHTYTSTIRQKVM